MAEVRLTTVFAAGMAALRDRTARDRIVARLRRIELGNPGDVKPVGEGVSELRINHGPGYRLYFVSRGDTLIVMLCGGDKKTQADDIVRAKQMAKEL
jgi:putative addiction module killer protein